MARMDGKVVLITGSGGGIGRADATLMAERGADIIVHDVKAEGARETGEAVKKFGRRAHVIVADILDTKRMAEEIAKAEAAMGRIDVLVNNAGIGGDYTYLQEIDEARLDRMFGVHLRGTFFCTRAVVPGMKARKAGKIVNISSNWGMVGHKFSSH